MNDVNVRLLEVSEKGSAVEVMVRCFGDEMRAAAVADVDAGFADYPYVPITLVALDREGVMLGTIQVITAYFNSNSYSLLWLAVLPEYRRRGIGAGLMRAAEEHVVRSRFNDADGTFLLVAGHDPNYYRRLGYEGSLLTHQGLPVMVKIHRAHT